MTKFTPGLWKCRDGSKAEVFKEADGMIFGRINSRSEDWQSWYSYHWKLNGGSFSMPEQDLISPWVEEPVRVEGWVNVGLRKLLTLHLSEEEADREGAFGTHCRIACRRITYAGGEVMSEDECKRAASEVFRGRSTFDLERRMLLACKAYIEAWKRGRIYDSTPEGL